MAGATKAFRQSEREAQAPYTRCALVTGNDSNDLAFTTRGISIASAGAIKVTTDGGDVVVIPAGALAVGVIHKLAVSRVWATGTGAGGIVSFW